MKKGQQKTNANISFKMLSLFEWLFEWEGKNEIYEKKM